MHKQTKCSRRNTLAAVLVCASFRQSFKIAINVSRLQIKHTIGTDRAACNLSIRLLFYFVNFVFCIVPVLYLFRHRGVRLERLGQLDEEQGYGQGISFR